MLQNRKLRFITEKTRYGKTFLILSSGKI